MAQDERDIVAEIQGTFAEHFKTLADRHEAEVKAQGEATAETKSALEKVERDLDDAVARLHAIEVGKTRGGDAGVDIEAKRAAVVEWVKSGDMAEAVTKGMRVADDTTGGFLAPVEVAREIVSGIVEFSPVRQVAAVRSTSARAVQFPKRTGVAVAAWVDEVEDRAETTGPTLGMDEVPTHEQYARVKVSKADLEDTEFNLAGFIEDSIREQFGVAEGTAFVSGDGVKRPLGFLVTGQNVSDVASGGASTLTADGLIDLVHALPDGYARNGAFMLKRTTVGAIRKLKDPGTGSYLWQPGLMAGVPATILGYPYVEAIDMPVVEASALAVAFGDWRRFYQIVDRVAVEFTRDEVTEARYGNVILHARKRVGGQIKDPNAVVIQRVASS